MNKPLPSQQELRRMFEYDADSGSLRWRWRNEMPLKRNRRFVGKEAGFRHGRDGRRKVEIDRNPYFLQRVIWKLVHGTEPDEVDHKNKNPADNRLDNLRLATKAENRRNRRTWAGRTLPKGVHICNGRYQAAIRVDRKAIHLGTFDTADEAHAAYCAAAAEHHGEFASFE